jgi:hypothetical protein
MAKLISPPEIYSFLDISTAHITEEDNKQLDIHALKGELPVYALNEYGWFVWAETEFGDDMSSAIKDVLEIARAHECAYVRFDRDGREYDELPKFEW